MLFEKLFYYKFYKFKKFIQLKKKINVILKN